MAVRLVKGTEHYQGVHADDKPTAGVVAGSTFHETDTNARFTYDGAAWRSTYVTVVSEDGRPVERTTNEILEELLLETKLLRHALVLQGIMEDIEEPAL